MTGKKNGDAVGYECIDQNLGSNLWRLDADDTAPELRKRLETHLKFCADCRIQRRVVAEVSSGLEDGSLKLEKFSSAHVLSRSITATGLLALAASLFLMFMLPPVARHQTLVLRGDSQGQAIISPVPDEIMRDSTPEITWQPMPDATSYLVRVEGVGNAYKWEQKTTSPEIQIPEGKKLPTSERFRVFVEPIPAYLAPAGGWRSSFSTASLLPFVKYRIGAASPEIRGLGTFALGLLVLGALTPLVWNRRLKI